MKVAYADPPYLGQGRRHYGRHHAQAGEYDTIDGHRDLLVRLLVDYPDGWALSASAPSLFPLLSQMTWPADVRMAAWVKPFASFKPGVNPAYAWEPVIFRGGRRRTRDEPTVRDWVAANITLRKGLTGVKPPQFCAWLFDLLGLSPDDQFDDLFPGSGAVSRMWGLWRERKS